MRYFVSIKAATGEVGHDHRCAPDYDTAYGNALYRASQVGGKVMALLPDKAAGCYCNKVAPHNCDFCTGLR